MLLPLPSMIINTILSLVYILDRILIRESYPKLPLPAALLHQI
jgi:hypothetical protein